MPKFNIDTESRWETKNSETCLYLGKVKVATTFYDSMRPIGSPKTHRVNWLIGGLKSDLGSYPNENEAKARAEMALQYWIDNFLTVNVNPES